MEHQYVAIMAGGIGSRFWPASRVETPKQFLDILGVGKSLLRMTFERFLPIIPAGHIYVITHARYQSLVMEQLPELSSDQVVCEPSRNNTAPCVAYIASRLHARDRDANFVVAPSDHLILEEDQFREDILHGLTFTARQDALLTLGIRPVRPDTGYGYIQYAASTEAERIHPVLRFTEKPPLDQAKAFVDSGDYLWNAGIFMWRAAVVLEELQRHAPEIIDILQPAHPCYGSPQEQAFINKQYPQTPSISIDYALMEKSDRVYTQPVHFGWSDLGTWASLHAQAQRDEYDNMWTGEHIHLRDTHDCLIRVPAGKLALIRGLEDYIVVDEGDVLLIYPKSEEQTIKQERQQLEQSGGGFF